MVSGAVTITLRLRQPLRVEIETAAKANGISMNAEMVDRLSRSFDDDRLDRIEAKLDKLLGER